MKKIAFAVLTLVSVSSFAAGGYGAAGCGLGSMLFEKDNSKVKQVFAGTTNGTSGSQTFGISSGTSNCDSASSGTVSLANYIEANKIALNNDVSRGQGQTLTAISQVLGCSDSNELGLELQKNYGSIFADDNAENVAYKIKAVTSKLDSCKA